MFSLNVRPSQVPSWMDCAARAAFERDNPEPRHAQPVALAVGNEVHRRLTGHEYETPESILYDDHTPTASDMRFQIDQMEQAVKKCLETHELAIEENEYDLVGGAPGVFRDEAGLKRLPIAFDGMLADTKVFLSGTADWVARRPDGSLMLLDIKTGKTFPAQAWMQLAVYLWMSDRAGLGIQDAGILWVRRKRNEYDLVGDLAVRPATELVENVPRILIELAVVARFGAIPNPNSKFCSAKCRNVACAMHPGGNA